MADAQQLAAADPAGVRKVGACLARRNAREWVNHCRSRRAAELEAVRRSGTRQIAGYRGHSMADKYGFPLDKWEAAKAEARAILVDCAKARQMIPYSELTPQIRSIRLEPHDARFFHFLGEISSAEAKAGRGMLTALVVHKSGDFQPGPGFFELAKDLGHKVDDIEKFWIKEVKKVFATWAS